MFSSWKALNAFLRASRSNPVGQVVVVVAVAAHIDRSKMVMRVVRICDKKKRNWSVGGFVGVSFLKMVTQAGI